MSIPKLLILYFLVLLSFEACKTRHPVSAPQIVEHPADMDKKVSENLRDVLEYALDSSGRINDSIIMQLPGIVESFYHSNDYQNIWSKNEHWQPLSDSLFDFISRSMDYGLYPSDYHKEELDRLKASIKTDSMLRKDAASWIKADLMLSDAFMQITKDIKYGRLLHDTIALRRDSTQSDSFYIKKLDEAFKKGKIQELFDSLEPNLTGYRALKVAIPDFIENMDNKKYSFIRYPDKDSLRLIKNLYSRLAEGHFTDSTTTLPDPFQLSHAIKQFQKSKELKQDGKVSPLLIQRLNSNDEDRFRRIAITLDRYKQLPEQMPVNYIWVNLPSFYLQVWDHDTIVILSKVIVGKPTTHTPTLTSAITDMVTYPQWTIPNSIIKKDILPALKKSPDYLAKKGFSLVDERGETVNPYTVNWQKYTKGIPYKVVQGSGDDNALGILKFNFNNPYSVYLHDTNQRYLFKKTERALSHGCVRVQEWQKLADYIARNDSMSLPEGSVLKYNTDSIRVWLANKVRKRIPVHNKLALFIRYFTCEGKDGKVIFYDDIYGDDKSISDRYFAGKTLIF